MLIQLPNIHFRGTSSRDELYEIPAKTVTAVKPFYEAKRQITRLHARVHDLFHGITQRYGDIS